MVEGTHDDSSMDAALALPTIKSAIKVTNIGIMQWGKV